MPCFVDRDTVRDVLALLVARLALGDDAVSFVEIGELEVNLDGQVVADIEARVATTIEMRFSIERQRRGLVVDRSDVRPIASRCRATTVAVRIADVSHNSLCTEACPLPSTYTIFWFAAMSQSIIVIASSSDATRSHADQIDDRSPRLMAPKRFLSQPLLAHTRH